MTPAELARQVSGLKIEIRDVSDLMPYARNAKEHPEWQIALLANLIKEFGFLVPIVVREDGTIAAGHGRVMAALKIGLERVPTISARHLSEDQIRAFTLADNKIVELAPWDMGMVRLEIEELIGIGFNPQLTGFGTDEIAKIMETKSEPSDGEKEKPQCECPQCGLVFPMPKQKRR